MSYWLISVIPISLKTLNDTAVTFTSTMIGQMFLSFAYGLRVLQWSIGCCFPLLFGLLILGSHFWHINTKASSRKQTNTNLLSGVQVPSGGQLGEKDELVKTLKNQISHGGEVTVDLMKVFQVGIRVEPRELAGVVDTRLLQLTARQPDIHAQLI